MAKRKKSNRTTKKTESSFQVSTEQKKKVLGVFFLLVSVFLLLSIISYDRKDISYLNFSLLDLFGGGSGSPHNWLNIVGAYLAHLTVHSTLGVFSIVYPVIIALWGYSFFQPVRGRLLVNITNFLLIMALLLAAFSGVLYARVDALLPYEEIPGALGILLGSVLVKLIGLIGSLILVTALIVTVFIISFDLKIERLFEMLKGFMSSAATSVKEKMEERSREREKEKNNLKKIRDLRKAEEEKKKAETPAPEQTTGEVEAQDFPEPEVTAEIPAEEESREAKIRIVKKKRHKPEEDDLELEPDETEEEPEISDIPVDGADRVAEAELPEPWEEQIRYKPLTLDLLEDEPEEDISVTEEELKRQGDILVEKLSLFDIEIKDIEVTPGPVVTLYELKPAPGVKISKIVGLENDIALALAARGIRIIAPIPGKSVIGVEIPNATASLVVAREIIRELRHNPEYKKYRLPLALGKTIVGKIQITDLAQMPHMLIAGSTGSGKSVGINMMVASLIYAKHPSEVKFAIVDPKKIELSFYKKLRHHYLAVSPDLDEDIVTETQNAAILLKCVVLEMEKRYDMLAKAGVRDIHDYNRKLEDPERKPKDTDKVKHHYLPFIVVIIDELADLMITSGKEVEEPITRLAQLARAVGIHLLVATQRPSVNVITGTIKANFSARIAYQVASKIDSRTILDMNGAEQLLGKGDMLFLPGGMPKPMRVQNAFISTDEVEKLTDHVQKQKGFSKPYFLPSVVEKKDREGNASLADRDEMFADAARVVVNNQQGSVSLLQRRLKLGYSRAARIMDQLEDAYIVAPSDGTSKARDVLVDSEEELETILRGL